MKRGRSIPTRHPYNSRDGLHNSRDGLLRWSMCVGTHRTEDAGRACVASVIPGVGGAGRHCRRSAHQAEQTRSWTVRGDEAHVASVQADLVAEFGLRRVAKPADAARLTVCELIERFLTAPRMWSPATYRSYGSPARFLARDALGVGGPGSPDAGEGRRGDRPLDPRGGRAARRAGSLPAVAFGDHLGDARAVSAVRSARRAPSASRLWLQLATAREGEHPLDAIPIYQQDVERAIGAKNNDAYRSAVERLDHISKLMTAAGHPEAFAPYAAEVRARHKPKRNLMKLFDQRGW